MDKLDVPVSKPGAKTPLPVSKPPAAWWRRYWDALAVLLLVFAAMAPALLSPRALVIVFQPSMVDDSWVLDTSFKASRGLWLGRDVAFTYGPLFQWLSSAPSRWIGLSMGAIYATYHVLPLWVIFIFSFLTLRLLMPEQPPWKRFLLLLLLLVFWSPFDSRLSIATFLFALFLRGWYAVRQQSLRPVVLGCAAALLCAASFLYSADTGVYAIAAWVLSLAGVVVERRLEPQPFRRYASALLGFAVVAVLMVIAINVFMAKPLDFSFWRNSFAIIGAYRWLEPSAMSKADTLRFLAPLLVGTIVFALRAALRSGREGITTRTGFLLSAFVFALFAMQSGLVRSDKPHIKVAVFTMVFFVGTILFSFRSRVASAVVVLVAVVASLLLGSPAFYPSVIRYHYAQVRRPMTQCPNGFREFDRGCFPTRFGEMLYSVSGYLEQRSGPRDSMAVFPYQTMFGVASRRNAAGGVMQSYLVSGAHLSQLDIAGFERAAAPVGLYLPDKNLSHVSWNDLSVPIDGVPNFTRSPEVWLWFFRHYRSEQEVFPGIVGLRKDDARAAEISLQAQPLNVAAQTYPMRTPISVVELGMPAWPVDGADFLRLRLTARYGVLWKLRKPERLQLEITRMDGSQELKTFLVQPNVSSEVWFYPWSEPDLANYFDQDETRWRTTPRPAITNLRIWVSPLDWISQQPDSIVIDGADAVKVSMRR